MLEMEVVVLEKTGVDAVLPDEDLDYKLTDTLQTYL
jgi:hypothetical protein